MFRLIGWTTLSLLVTTLASGQTAAPQFKAIWEPVPFNRDINLTAIACTGPDTCWVAGDKSTILFTSDGGTTWDARLGGDPEATDEDLAEIVFLDAQHGWVLTERNRVMGTADGRTWEELSKVPSTSRSVWFLTPQAGLVADRSDSQSQSHLNRTQDGGRTWVRSDPCSVEATVNGLPRKMGCMVRDIQFLSPTVGFMGGTAVIDMANEMAAFSRTDDGGITWRHAVIPTTKRGVDSIQFWSEQEGVVLLSSGQTFWTADGGSTWTGSVNPPAWRSYYASGRGQIIVGVNQNGRQAGYSFNGGRNFTSRALGLPAQVEAVAFPDAQHGYLVGQHGMVYRYRIVPVAYKSEGMIAAPAPPSR